MFLEIYNCITYTSSINVISGPKITSNCNNIVTKIYSTCNKIRTAIYKSRMVCGIGTCARRLNPDLRPVRLSPGSGENVFRNRSVPETEVVRQLRRNWTLDNRNSRKK
jgi:hypothetical protein